MNRPLARAFPRLAESVGAISLADLPTPISKDTLPVGDQVRTISIKRDDLSAGNYGGNKVRKLEYLLTQARDRRRSRVATFGTVGSHHAIATAIYAKKLGFACTCFLFHQSLQPGLGDALRLHQQLGTEVIRYGGDRKSRIRTLREHLQHRDAWVVPMGGSSWRGCLGYVNAGLELAEQLAAGKCPVPARIYIAMGTMGSAAGLALGLALAGVDSTVEAVRVSPEPIASEAGLLRLIGKTAMMMRRYEPAIPDDLDRRVRIRCRHAFFGDGYGRSNAETDRAIAIAADALGMTLEQTYTGKAMAALIHDLEAGCDEPVLFWNTYNSRPLDVDRTLAPDFDRIPEEFARYFDS